MQCNRMVTHPASPHAVWATRQGSGQGPGLGSGDDARLRGAPPPTPLLPLRDIVQSLREAEQGVPPQGKAQKRLRSQVRAMGTAALPALLRALRSENACVVDWACDLLGSIADAQLPDLCERLDTILVDPQVQDATKARILGLLADLQAPVPTQVLLQDPDAMIRTSVRDLIADLSNEQAMAQALDLLFCQVSTDDLPRFLSEVARHGGASAQPFLAAVITDPRTPRTVAQGLMQTQRPLAAPAPRADRPSTGRRAKQPSNLQTAGDYQAALASCRAYLATLSTVPTVAIPTRMLDVTAGSGLPTDSADRCFRSLRLHYSDVLRASRAVLPVPAPALGQ